MEDKFKSHVWKSVLTNPLVITAAFMLLAVTAILVGHVTLNRYQVEADGSTVYIQTHSNDVDGILLQHNIEVNPADTLYVKSLAYRNQLISIRNTHKVTLEIDRHTREYYATGGTLENLFAQAGVTFGEHDTVQPSLQTEISDDMTVTVERVSIKTQTIQEEIAPPVEDRSDGGETFESPGKAGLRQTTFECRYVNGVLTEKTELESTVLREPTATVIRSVIPSPAGTGETVVTQPNPGAPADYSRVLICEATAYTGGGITASGLPAQYGRVAVDPRVIPLGSQLYIESEDGSYVYGYAVAADTGGAIKGNKVDIYLDSYNQAIQFGRRNLRVYVIS